MWHFLRDPLFCHRGTIPDRRMDTRQRLIPVLASIMWVRVKTMVMTRNLRIYFMLKTEIKLVHRHEMQFISFATVSS